MKIISLFLVIILSTLDINCVPNTNVMKNEKQIIEILKLLEEEYYWQFIPLDLKGFVRKEDIVSQKEMEEKYPFRLERDALLNKLDILFNKELSTDFLASLLLEKKHERALLHYRTHILDALFRKESEMAYEKLFQLFKQEAPAGDNDIGKKLTFLNKYTDEIENYILENDTTGINGFTYFCNYAGTPYGRHSTFSEATKEEILKRVILFMTQNIDDNPDESAKAVSLFEGYYRQDFKEYPEQKDNSWEGMNKWREEGCRLSAKNVITYYQNLEKKTIGGK